MNEPPARQVLNAHVGLKNHIEYDDINTTLADTFAGIKATLSDHCGPYGKYAMLTDSSNPRAQPTFTKDGINIVSATEYASHMERYVNGTVAYIGTKIEQAGGDGTTSSMIISTHVLDSLRTLLNGTPKPKQVNPCIKWVAKLFGFAQPEHVPGEAVSFGQMGAIYGKFCDEVEKRLNKIAAKVTPDSPKELIFNIAYNQAMTSSHGDKQLSLKVAEMFSSMPQPAWDHVIFKTSPQETGEPYSIEVDKSDYRCAVNQYSNMQYNNDAGTEYKADNVKLMITTLGLIQNSLDYSRIRANIESAIANNTNLCIIATGMADVTVRQDLDVLLQTDDNNNVTIYFIPPMANRNVDDMWGLLATLGIFAKELNDEAAEVNDVSVHYVNGQLSILNANERTKDGLHPSANDPESPAASYMTLLKDIAKAEKSAAKQYINKELLQNINRIHNTIHLQHCETLIIGGRSYDIQAAIPVVEDTLKATRAALRSGALLGGFTSLQIVLTEMSKDKDIDHITQEIVRSYIEAIKLVKEYTIKYAPKRINGDLTTSLIKKAEDQNGCLNVLTGIIGSHLDIAGNNTPVITQPVIVDMSLIRRFGEVALKFLFTSRIVIPNGVILKEDKNVK